MTRLSDESIQGEAVKCILNEVRRGLSLDDYPHSTKWVSEVFEATDLNVVDFNSKIALFELLSKGQYNG